MPVTPLEQLQRGMLEKEVIPENLVQPETVPSQQIEKKQQVNRFRQLVRRLFGR